MTPDSPGRWACVVVGGAVDGTLRRCRLLRTGCVGAHVLSEGPNRISAVNQMARRNNHSVQLTLDAARRPTGRGGWRPGAGRPRGRAKTSHDRREPILARHPQHVTLRVKDGILGLRRKPVLRFLHDAIRIAGNQPELRIVHFNLLDNHLHMIVETTSAAALGHAMQGFTIRLAKGVNRVLGRSGRVFAERYHARALPTPTEVRNALRYVLLNGNRHEIQRGAKLVRFGVDPFSSGVWFDGWADERWKHEVPDAPRPTALPTTWLLREGWRKAGGPIAFDNTPGAARRRQR